MPKCELIVARHGETTWNKEGKQQGHLDSPLSELGVRQAERIGERLETERFGALYTSDLGRAYATAERIAAKTGHDIRVDVRLRERNLGIFQTLTMEEVARRYPEEYARFRSGDPDYVIPEGESARERHARAIACVEEIGARHAGERVVIVAHGGVLQSLFRHAVGLPLEAPRGFSLFNASINTFFVEHGKWKLGMWGDTSHLKGTDSLDDF